MSVFEIFECIHDPHVECLAELKLVDLIKVINKDKAQAYVYEVVYLGREDQVQAVINLVQFQLRFSAMSLLKSANS